MRAFVTKAFARFASRAALDEDDLLQAVKRIASGVVDADLGGGVIKQRIARKGEGKSGGYRSILLLRRGRMIVFVYGFAKSDRVSIRDDELRAFRKLAADVLNYDDTAIAKAVKLGAIREIGHHG